MRKLIFLLVFLLAVPCVFAGEMPEGYYTTANGKSDSILKSTLRQIIRAHTVLSYGSGEGSSWYCFYYSDRDTATGLCMDMYCDDWKPFTTPGAVVSGCNIEHSFAKSWWGGANNDAYKDCYHLNPSNITANSARSNYPLGVPTQDFKDPSTTGSLRIGKRYSEEYGTYHYVFEPKDEYKGDFARAYFYMATCYGDELTWRKNNPDVGSYYAMRSPTDNDAYLEFLDWEIDVLLAWHRQDPVSIKEINRADAVNNFQNNRNPFIDYPCLVEYIWGNRKGENVDFSRLMSSLDVAFLGCEDKSGCDCTITVPTLTLPQKNTEIELGNTTVDSKRSTTLTIKGELLTEDITLSISGVNAEYFTVSPTTVSAAQALEGYNVTVSYLPMQLGEHSAILTITSSEFTAVPVTLSGSCIFSALEATEITKNSFKANWTNAGVSDYTLNVFTQTMTGKEPTTFYSESFEAGQGDFTIDDKKIPEELSYIWKWDSQYGMKASAFLNQVAYESESWLISPEINLQNAVSAKLTFRHARRFGDLSHLSVKISDDNGINWTNLTIANWPDGSNWNFLASGDVILDAYIGKTVKIAFVYTSTTSGAATWEIKNFVVDGEKSALAKTLITGFPKLVSNVQNYVVTGLTPKTNYFYTVTPAGFEKSNEISVTTLAENETMIDYVETNSLVYYKAGDMLHVLNIEPETIVKVFDCTGRLVESRNHCASEEVFTLPKGVYLFKALNNGRTQSFKIVY